MNRWIILIVVFFSTIQMATADRYWREGAFSLVDLYTKDSLHFQGDDFFEQCFFPKIDPYNEIEFVYFAFEDARLEKFRLDSLISRIENFYIRDEFGCSIPTRIELLPISFLDNIFTFSQRNYCGNSYNDSDQGYYKEVFYYLDIKTLEIFEEENFRKRINIPQLNFQLSKKWKQFIQEGHLQSVNFKSDYGFYPRRNGMEIKEETQDLIEDIKYVFSGKSSLQAHIFWVGIGLMVQYDYPFRSEGLLQTAKLRLLLRPNELNAVFKNEDLNRKVENYQGNSHQRNFTFIENNNSNWYHWLNQHKIDLLEIADTSISKITEYSIQKNYPDTHHIRTSIYERGKAIKVYGNQNSRYATEIDSLVWKDGKLVQLLKMKIPTAYSRESNNDLPAIIGSMSIKMKDKHENDSYSIHIEKGINITEVIYDGSYAGKFNYSILDFEHEENEFYTHWHELRKDGYCSKRENSCVKWNKEGNILSNYAKYLYNANQQLLQIYKEDNHFYLFEYDELGRLEILYWGGNKYIYNYKDQQIIPAQIVQNFSDRIMVNWFEVFRDN